VNSWLNGTHSQLIGNSSDYLRYEQRMAADPEEIIMDSNSI
jgi:hypothetical protein